MPWVRNIAGGLVAAGVVLEFFEGYVSHSWQKTVDDAKELQITELTNDTARLSREAEAARAAMAQAIEKTELAKRDAAIAEQRAQEAKKLAGPRNIVGADKEYVRNALAQFRGVAYDLTLPPLQHNPFPTFVEQGSQLPEHIMVILSNLCGWELRSVEGHVKKVALPLQQRLLTIPSAWVHQEAKIFIPDILVGEMSGVSGVKIVLPPEGRSQDAATALWLALDHIGIVAGMEYPPPNNNVPADAFAGDAVHIIIGTKP